MEPLCKEEQPQAARLGLWDTTSIIVGIIVGVGIYIAPSGIFSNVAGPWHALALWVLGGLLSLVGAFCFAELASTYPRSGGEYVYLTRAFGRWLGFLFAWAQLAVIRTGGGIAAVAYLCTPYAVRLLHPGREADPDPEAGSLNALLAAAAIAILTLVNILGVRFGKLTQNLLTGLKVVGIVGILLAGFLAAQAHPSGPALTVRAGAVVHVDQETLVLRDRASGSDVGLRTDGARITIDGSQKDTAGRKYQPADLQEGMTVHVVMEQADPEHAVRIKAASSPWAGLALCMILVLWTYAGWHEAAYVASEVRDRRRNLPLALLLGTAAVMVLYLLINLAYLGGLGFVGAADSPTVAAELLDRVLHNRGGWVMSVLVVLSALGALNGMTWTSSRIFAELGADHRLFAPLGVWNRRLGTPVLSLLVQGVLSVGMVLVVGLCWPSRNGFDSLLNCTAAVFWLFFLLTGVALFVLRFKDPHLERPFRVPGYPLTPLLFCVCCGVMMYGSVVSAPWETLVGVGILVAGVPLYLLSQGWKEHGPRLPKGPLTAKRPEPLSIK